MGDLDGGSGDTGYMSPPGETAAHSISDFVSITVRCDLTTFYSTPFYIYPITFQPQNKNYALPVTAVPPTGAVWYEGTGALDKVLKATCTPQLRPLDASEPPPSGLKLFTHRLLNTEMRLMEINSF